jgi:DNA (cytosine-5)-methyltransferase 1
VMAHHFPTVSNLGDVTKVDWDAVEPVDLIVFGSPCQSFSVAGQRRGLDDPRGDMALIGLRVVERVRPCWMVFENVPGLLSSDEGRDFGAFLGELGKCGYGFAYRVLDARYAGVPQRRRRVFVVGYLGDWRPAAAVLFEPQSLRWDPPPRREAGKEVASSLRANSSPNSRRHSYGLRGDGADNLIAFGGNNTASPIDIATACNAKGGSGRMDFETETFIAFDARQSDVCVYGDQAGTLDSDPYTLAVAFAQNARAEVRLEGGDGQILGALTSGGGTPGKSYPAIADGRSVRRLTPRECERLQGLPDDFTLIRYNGKPAADGPRYRALGNAMAVPVIGWILARIKKLNANKAARA